MGRICNTKTLFNIRVDAELKQQAEKIFSSLGIPTSTAITMFLKSTVRCNGFPFSLTLDPFYSAENQARLQKTITAYEHGVSQTVRKNMQELEGLSTK